MKIKLLILAVLISFGSTGKTRGAERYYMLIFGSQSEPFAIRFTHTFALFVKATGDGDDPRQFKLETHSISWMPRSLSIRVLAPAPEAGVNLSLPDTLAWANSVGAQSTLWGPFEVRKEIFESAARQADQLNSGAASYICNDRRFRGREATNCIHAVADVHTSNGLLMTGTQCGHAGSQAVLKHLSPHILPSEMSNRWLCDRLKITPEAVRFATPDEPVKSPVSANSSQASK